MQTILQYMVRNSSTLTRYN